VIGCWTLQSATTVAHLSTPTRITILWFLHACEANRETKNVQLTMAYPRDAKPCQKFLQLVKDRKLLILPTPPLFDAPSGGTPWDIDVIYTPLKSAFNGLQFRRWHYRSIFIHLAVVASQSREITGNSDKIWPYSSSRSSKVIDLGVNQKPMYDFLLVTNTVVTLAVSATVFEILTLKARKSLNFPTPPLFEAPFGGTP